MLSLLALLLVAKVGSPLLVALIAAIAAPLGAYLLAARRLSGRIETSEAASLWLEAGKLRQEYKDEIAELRRQVVACEERLGIAEDRNRSLGRDNAQLTAQVEKLEATILGLRTELRECKEIAARLEGELREARAA